MQDEQLVGSPATTAAQLAEIAARRPDLWPYIEHHPAAYPGLIDWIARSRAAMTAPGPAASQPQAPIAGGYAVPGASAVGHAAPAPGYGASAAPFATAPADPTAGAVPASGPAGDPSPRPKRGLVITLAAVLVGVLVLGGGATLWAVNAFARGAGSPIEAGDRLVSAVTALDPMQLGGIIAPSEIDPFSTAISDAQKEVREQDEEAMREAERAGEELRGALTVTVEERVTWKEQVIDADVVKIVPLTGVIVVDGDPDRIASAAVRMARSIAYAQAESLGYSRSMIDEQLRYAEEGLRDDLRENLPLTLRAGDLQSSIREIGDGAAEAGLIAVREGGRWYLSPLMTVADAASLFSSAPYGTVVAPLRAGTPDEAFQNTLTAVDHWLGQGGTAYREVAATLPLAERRVVSVYGEKMSLGELNPMDVDLSGSVATTEEGRRALLQLTRLVIDAMPGSRHGFVLTIEGTCWTWEDRGSSRTPQRKCLRDMAPPEQVRQLRLDDWRLVTVQEDGGWHFSVIATAGYIAELIVGGLAEA